MKVVVGMSGGVDSSVSLILLKKKGYEPIGVSLKLPVWKSKFNQLCENICCTKESLELARSVCKKLHVPYYIYDVSKEFKKEVVDDYFISELKKGRTPNPCIICNRYHKFSKLLEFAKKKGIKYVASGHYAKKVKDVKTKEFKLVKPKDKNKDQTYGLSLLKQIQLQNIIFPLSDLLKSEVFKIAEKEGFEIFLKKKESQNFCFVSNKSIPKFLEKEIGIKPGKIFDTAGNILGTHKGVHFFTIGQRKGLSLLGTYFVKEKNKNNLIVTKNKKEVGSNEIYLRNTNFISNNSPKKIIDIMARTRHTKKLSKAKLVPLKLGYKVIFKKFQNSVTPGQFCVFYKENVCLGGGIIK